MMEQNNDLLETLKNLRDQYIEATKIFHEDQLTFCKLRQLQEGLCLPLLEPLSKYTDDYYEMATLIHTCAKELTPGGKFNLLYYWPALCHVTSIDYNRLCLLPRIECLNLMIKKALI